MLTNQDITGYRCSSVGTLSHVGRALISFAIKRTFVPHIIILYELERHLFIKKWLKFLFYVQKEGAETERQTDIEVPLNACKIIIYGLFSQTEPDTCRFKPKVSSGLTSKFSS